MMAFRWRRSRAEISERERADRKVRREYLAYSGLVVFLGVAGLGFGIDGAPSSIEAKFAPEQSRSGQFFVSSIECSKVCTVTGYFVTSHQDYFGVSPRGFQSKKFYVGESVPAVMTRSTSTVFPPDGGNAWIFDGMLIGGGLIVAGTGIAFARWSWKRTPEVGLDDEPEVD